MVINWGELSIGPQDAQGLEHLPWEERRGEQGCISPKKRWPRRGPSICLPIWRGSSVVRGRSQRGHKLKDEMFQPCTRRNFLTRKQRYSLPTEVVDSQLLEDFKTQLDTFPATWVWTQSRPCLGLPSNLSYTMILFCFIRLLESRRGSIPGWGHLQHPPELGHSTALWNT